MTVYHEIQPFCDWEDWTVYYEQLEQYLLLNDIPVQKHTSLLLGVCLTQECYKILRDLCHPVPPKEKEFSELCAILESHFVKRVAVFRERIKFYSAKQETDEDVKEYYAKIKSLSVECKFGDKLPSVLLDKFISGLRPGAILDRLCEEKETITLSEVIDIALNKEASLEEPFKPEPPPEVCPYDGSSSTSSESDDSNKDTEKEKRPICGKPFQPPEPQVCPMYKGQPVGCTMNPPQQNTMENAGAAQAPFGTLTSTQPKLADNSKIQLTVPPSFFKTPLAPPQPKLGTSNLTFGATATPPNPPVFGTFGQQSTAQPQCKGFGAPATTSLFGASDSMPKQSLFGTSGQQNLMNVSSFGAPSATTGGLFGGPAGGATFGGPAGGTTFSGPTAAPVAFGDPAAAPDMAKQSFTFGASSAAALVQPEQALFRRTLAAPAAAPEPSDAAPKAAITPLMVKAKFSRPAIQLDAPVAEVETVSVVADEASAPAVVAPRRKRGCRGGRKK